MMIKPLKFASFLLMIMAASQPVQAQQRISPEYRLDRQQMRDMSREVHRPGRDMNPRAEDSFPGAQRNNRMSVEERRALRRQINEANQDIYAPPRR